MTRVRPLRDDDRTALRAIQAATLLDPTPDLLVLAADGALSGLVAVDTGDTPVGYLLAMVDDDRAYVPELAVAPARQREGIGSTLVETACARLAERGVATVRLTARAADAGVRVFYARRGFEAVDRVPDHYSDGVDGIVYERSL